MRLLFGVCARCISTTHFNSSMLACKAAYLCAMRAEMLVPQHHGMSRCQTSGRGGKRTVHRTRRELTEIFAAADQVPGQFVAVRLGAGAEGGSGGGPPGGDAAAVGTAGTSAPAPGPAVTADPAGTSAAGTSGGREGGINGAGGGNTAAAVVPIASSPISARATSALLDASIIEVCWSPTRRRVKGVGTLLSWTRMDNFDVGIAVVLLAELPAAHHCLSPPSSRCLCSPLRLC